MPLYSLSKGLASGQLLAAKAVQQSIDLLLSLKWCLNMHFLSVHLNYNGLISVNHMEWPCDTLHVPGLCSEAGYCMRIQTGQ